MGTASALAYNIHAPLSVNRMASSRASIVAAADLESAFEAATGNKQDFLEASPYWDQSTVPVNTYKNKSPFTGKIMSVKRIVGPEATGERCPTGRGSHTASYRRAPTRKTVSQTLSACTRL